VAPAPDAEISDATNRDANVGATLDSCATADHVADTNANATQHFCNWLVDEIEINRRGRFLVWDNELESWVRLLDKAKIKRKISVALYNYEKRSKVRAQKAQPAAIAANTTGRRAPGMATEDAEVDNDDDIGIDVGTDVGIDDNDNEDADAGADTCALYGGEKICRRKRSRDEDQDGEKDTADLCDKLEVEVEVEVGTHRQRSDTVTKATTG